MQLFVLGVWFASYAIGGMLANPMGGVDIGILLGAVASRSSDVKLGDIADMIIPHRRHIPYFAPSEISGRSGYPINPNAFQIESQ